MNEGERLQWAFGLLDKYSANADRMSAATGKFEAALGRADKILRTFEDSANRAGRAGNSFAGWSGPLGVAVGALKTGASWAFDLASGLADAAWEAGKFVVNALGFKESALVSFEMMLGSAEKARDLYQEASMFARITPFTSEQTIKSFQSILGAGYNVEETKVLFQALGDAASAAGDEMGAAMSGMTNALARIHGRQFVDAMHVHELTGWSSRVGVGQTQVYDAIAKNLGTSREGVMAMQSAGSLSSDAFIYGFVEAIQAKMGGKVGNMMLRQSHTIKGLLSTLESAPFDFLSNIDLDKSRGMKAFKGFLENLANLLDVNSAAGQRFASLFDRVFNDTFGSLFEDLAGPEGGKRLEDFFTKAVKFAGQLFDVTNKFVSLLSKVTPSLSSIENVLDRLDKLTSSGKGLVRPESGFLGNVNAEDFIELSNGRMIPKPEALISGSGLQSAELNSKAYAESITAGVSFKDIGDRVFAPARNAGPLIGQFVVQVDASNAGDPAGVLQAIRDQLPAELERLFDRLALESGRSS